ncbi:MAG TPA: WXG100 family type VII secretion target [Acidimicrobiia bacterium]|jgi:WXG100 family type VII secretion target
MSAMFGANLGDLVALKSLFDGKATEVGSLSSTLSGKLAPGATAWTGPGAEKFRAAWSNDFKPALGKLEEALREASVAVGKYHDNIEIATR